MSFEKRLRILPSGVVSKNDIGERKMLASILLWRVREAKMLAMASEKELKRTNRA